MSAPPPDTARLLAVSAAEFGRAIEADLSATRAEIARVKALSGRPAAEVLEAYDRAVELLSDASARASVCRNAHPDPALRDAADEAEQKVDQLATELSLDRGVYDALAAVDAAREDAATRHWVEKTLREFRRAGVDRDQATRARVMALREELVRIGQEFGRNIKDDVRRLELDPAELAGLPPDFVAAHPPGASGKATLTTDNTDYVPFMSYATSERAREAMWRLYRLRGHPGNLDVLARMLAKRHELATLLGYASWAAYVTEDKMIGSAEAAAEFIEKIARAAERRMQSDYGVLLARKKVDDPQAARVSGWDTAYLTERVKAEQHGFESQSVRPYFEYTRVRDGLLSVTGRLFGLEYRPVKDAPRWHEEVDVYDVFGAGDSNGGRVPLGRIHLDMFPREGKYKHYAQFTLAGGKRGVRLPEGALICNFPRPRPGAPALMEHGDVKTFFHEFGHLLHHVLGGHTRWAGIAGVATEWDFVEAPSQMLEEWVWDPGVLQSFARHHQTNEPIPAALVERMKAADEFGKGLQVRQQMFYAATSLELHRRAPGLDTTRLMAELQERYTPFRYVEGTYFHESFGHLDGYSAIYYTYMWSLVIAKDLFSEFAKAGLMDRGVAARYRKAVLEPGGAQPAARLVEAFLGRPYDFRAYEAWLDR